MAFYRSYDASIGRWGQVDPLAEKYIGMSPYTGMGNNPINNVDPKGDSIINKYEKYKQYRDLEKTLKENIANSSRGKERKAARKELRKNSGKTLGYNNYRIVDELISSFEKANKDEYEKINNLTFNEKNVDVVIGLSSLEHSEDNAVGVTRVSYDPNSMIKVLNFKTGKKHWLPTQIVGDEINITIYQNGKNLGTLANEFGDAIFSVEQPATSVNDHLSNLPYMEQGSTLFSFEYEEAIVKGKRPPKSSKFKKY